MGERWMFFPAIKVSRCFVEVGICVTHSQRLTRQLASDHVRCFPHTLFIGAPLASVQGMCAIHISGYKYTPSFRIDGR